LNLKATTCTFLTNQRISSRLRWLHDSRWHEHGVLCVAVRSCQCTAGFRTCQRCKLRGV